MRGPLQEPGGKEAQDEGAAAASGRPAGVPEAEKGSGAGSDSDQETEGARKPGELGNDTLYLRSCRAHSVVPASCFLRQGNAPELSLRHRGLGPQRLDLRDNGLCGVGAEALAGTLSKSRSICDVDLSENWLGAEGARAVCAALVVSPAVQRVQLAGNGLEEQAAQYLAELLLAHTGLKSLDLSYNQLNDQAVLEGMISVNKKVCRGVSEGETLGPALAENTGLMELSVSWNHLGGPGAVAFARGLEANIFLRVLDISYNGCGDSGASAVGEALKTNSVLEELYMGNNRISAAGALSLGLGLRVNQTLRILAVSASLMGEAPAQTRLCLPTQPPPHHISPWCLRAHGEGAPGFLPQPHHPLTHLWPGPQVPSDSRQASPHLPLALLEPRGHVGVKSPVGRKWPTSEHRR
ncbi:leucine-rich repeat-containing protein 74B isoform X2 [Moschus berezovskii]|uniref:leucine-rich repeat-containing protein 74B isoform X2 n=1 Tax=Moschus berezovskii TaxID=68408 RepID=UPI002444C97F|nr:leucine-rich repeat-containing protein 74B isoform X2 [Moschus berezovskii]